MQLLPSLITDKLQQLYIWYIEGSETNKSRNKGGGGGGQMDKWVRFFGGVFGFF